MESIRSNLSDSIARVSVSDVENTYPARIDNRLHYIKGYDTYVLAGPELMHLVAHSKLHGVYDFSTYQTEPIFTKFVTEMWAMRKKYKEEGNELFDRFVKLIMNSLYGKFAQKSPQWEPMPDMYDDRAFVQWPHIDLTTKKTTYFRSIGYNVEKMVDRVEKAGSFIAISSFITSYAREYMRGIRQAAGPRNVFYQGVDSVIVNRAGHNNLYMAGVIDQSELGKLKLQGVYETGNLHGMNDYEIGEKTVRSGMKDTAVMLPDGSFQQDEWSGVTSLFKQGKATITISETHKRRV